MDVLEFLYLACAVVLGVYGCYSLVLTGLYLFHARRGEPIPPPPDEWPTVTVQLPIYNEGPTAERALATLGQLDYPRDHLEIQVLDDSTDDTRERLAAATEALRAQGLQVRHLIREDRTGFKAGALSAGLAQATGELCAIFDADFLPRADFLKRVVPYFADENVACVQTRWTHANRDYSWLTALQALYLDSHFVIDQTARSRAGLLVQFNGTCGIWRRSAIDEAGGWQADTLTEDLDLSYRVQIQGRRIIYLPDVTVPGELPVQIMALKRQQARWAQGATQAALKLLGPLWRSRRPLTNKIESTMRLWAYIAQAMGFVLFLLTLPIIVYGKHVYAASPWLLLAFVGPVTLSCVAQIAQGRGALRRLLALPLLLLMAPGLALNTIWAMFKAFAGVRSRFERTPKYGVGRSGEHWEANAYAAHSDWLTWVEVGIAALSAGWLLSQHLNWSKVSGALLFPASMVLVAGCSVWQSIQRQRWLVKNQKRATAPSSGAQASRDREIIRRGGPGVAW
ncbi:MAG: glycosyltransferase [Anaerolineae bacterium]